MKRAIGLLGFAIACTTEGRHTVTLPHDEEPKPVETAHVALAQPTAGPRPSGNACLMLYECGCNAGCTEVDRSADALSPGMQVRAVSGPGKGTNVFVAKNSSDTGEPVLTVQRADPKGPMLCGSPRSAVIGYLCAGNNSGPARACTTCE